jgi:hypothetical protein
MNNPSSRGRQKGELSKRMMRCWQRVRYLLLPFKPVHRGIDRDLFELSALRGLVVYHDIQAGVRLWYTDSMVCRHC